MKTDFENDATIILLDNQSTIDSSSEHNPSPEMNKNRNKSIVKRPRPILHCVVCGDNAFGRVNNYIPSYLYYICFILY